jgi:hypothetical protein
LFVSTFLTTAIGVKNGIIEGCKCQVVLLNAVSNYFSVWL